ncbi:MAG: glycosyltransferase family 2 protein [Planctomycetes bacterium]|nr:glycosyltransferase family 2 protein [Planctomycetota bacterium]
MKRFFDRLLGERPRETPAAVSPGSSGPGGARATFEELLVRPGGPVADTALPRATIVILNYNGRHHLELCFTSLAKLDYPRERLEVLLIDNGSDDGSVEEMRAKHAWVRLHVNARNAGFAPACNQGAGLATRPEVLVFLNNDMRVEPSFLKELVAPLVRGECDATTAKMLSWDGKVLNSAGGGMNFHGLGFQYGMNRPPAPEFDAPRKTLFPCGGAMAIRASVYAEVGGFDPEFFAYYEDVDLGWRLWVQGKTVHYVPSSVCYHHHSSTSKSFPPEVVRLLQVRNPMYACFKNYDDENLRRVLPAMLALALRRMLILSGIPSDQPFRIEHASARPSSLVGKLMEKAHKHFESDIPIKRVAAADLIGINDLLSNWDHWMERRREVQSRRARSDQEIFRLFLKPMWCIEDDPAYRALQDGVSRFTGLDELFQGLEFLRGEPHK